MTENREKQTHMKKEEIKKSQTNWNSDAKVTHV